METASPPPPTPDQWSDSFDYECFRKFKLGGLRIANVAEDHIVLGGTTARRRMTMILFKQGGLFSLHAQNVAFGPLDREHCSDRNLVIRGDLQRVLKSVTLAPTRPRKRRKSADPTLFKLERSQRS